MKLALLKKMVLKLFYKISNMSWENLCMWVKHLSTSDGLLYIVVIVRGFAWEIYQVLKIAIHLAKLYGIASFM